MSCRQQRYFPAQTFSFRAKEILLIVESPNVLSYGMFCLRNSLSSVILVHCSHVMDLTTEFLFFYLPLKLLPFSTQLWQRLCS